MFPWKLKRLFEKGTERKRTILELQAEMTFEYRDLILLKSLQKHLQSVSISKKPTLERVHTVCIVHGKLLPKYECDNKYWESSKYRTVPHDELAQTTQNINV